MAKITFIQHNGTEQTVDGQPGHDGHGDGDQEHGARHRCRLRRRLRLRHLPCLCRAGMAGKDGHAQSAWKRTCSILPSTCATPAACPARSRCQRRARRLARPRSRKAVLSFLEFSDVRSDFHRCRDHWRGPLRPVRGFRAGPARHQMPRRRHSRPAGRPMRRALSGKADLRHSGAVRSSPARSSPSGCSTRPSRSSRSFISTRWSPN